MATDGDDTSSWKLHALENPNLVAALLLSLSEPRRIPLVPWKCPLDPVLISDTAAKSAGYAKPSSTEASDSPKRPSTSSSAPTVFLTADLLDWGRRIKRSRMIKVSGIFQARTAAAEAELEKTGSRQTSPRSPLEGCSSGSVSWGSGDGGERMNSQRRVAKRRRYLSVSTSVVSGRGGGSPRKREGRQKAAPVLPVAAPALAKRTAMKKATKEELLAMEKSLLKEREKMQKELEEWCRATEELKAANRELQSTLDVQATVAATMELERIQLPDSSLPVARQSGGNRHILPDLNEPPTVGCQDLPLSFPLDLEASMTEPVHKDSCGADHFGSIYTIT